MIGLLNKSESTERLLPGCVNTSSDNIRSTERQFTSVIRLTENPTELRLKAVVMKLLERITIEPGKCGGRPCIRGMRIRVTDILGMLAEGVSHEEILKDFPYLEPDDIKAVLAYAA